MTTKRELEKKICKLEQQLGNKPFPIARACFAGTVTIACWIMVWGCIMFFVGGSPEQAVIAGITNSLIFVYIAPSCLHGIRNWVHKR